MTFPIFACPICKRLGYRRALCAYCAEQLWHRREPVSRFAIGHHIHSLFSWRKDGWLGLRWWIMNLKHKEHSAFWLEPALWALNTFPPPPDEPVLIPIPSSGENHALGFARELNRLTGWPLRQPLRLGLGQEQKELSREARQGRHFELTDCSKYTTVLIIDDVVTTGATVKAAYVALQRPKNCEVWCLLDRRPCGSGAPLL